MAKPCKEDQIRNPDSNRCVSKTSAIGKRVIKKLSKAAAAPAAPAAPAARAARAAPPVRVRPPASEAYKEQLRRDNPSIPMNMLLDMFPEPIIDSDEIKASRIPVFSKRSKPCPEDKIKDPETKKCIKINSVKGREILDKIREIYHGEDRQEYVSNNPFTIKYDNRQLTVPGLDALRLETDIPQRNRDCPPKTIRDPNNPDKCIKHNSKKGREIIAKYRDYYKRFNFRYDIPDYLDIPEFNPDYLDIPELNRDTIRSEFFTLPAIEKLSKKALEKLEELRNLHKYKIDELNLIILQKDEEIEFLKRVADGLIDPERYVERNQADNPRDDGPLDLRRSRHDIAQRDRLASSVINNPDNMLRYLQSKTGFINMD